jgi:CheY-like chemotaxis protein
MVICHHRRRHQKTKTKRKILLVDDEPDVTFTLKKGLENNGMFQVDAFNDPLEAISI